MSINHKQLDALISEEKSDTVNLCTGKNILDLWQQHICKQPPVRSAGNVESPDYSFYQEAEFQISEVKLSCIFANTRKLQPFFFSKYKAKVTWLYPCYLCKQVFHKNKASILEFCPIKFTEKTSSPQCMQSHPLGGSTVSYKFLFSLLVGAR